MRERPILFAAPSVRGIFAGRKSQTRRIITSAIDEGGNPAASVHPDGSGRGWIAWWPDPVTAEETRRLYPGKEGFPCPYGLPGDRLWCRETWAPSRFSGKGLVGITWLADGQETAILPPPRGYVFPPDASEQPDIPRYPESIRCQTRSSMFMPRWASRLLLEITEVHVQRLQEITEVDAIAEGLRTQAGDGPGPGPGYKWRGIAYEGARAGYFHVPSDDERCSCQRAGSSSAVCAYSDLWDSINAKRGYSWESNPWVWAISFKEVSRGVKG